MTDYSILAKLGEPKRNIAGPKGNMQMWSDGPFMASRVTGYATRDMVMEMDRFWRYNGAGIDDIVTVHHWGGLTDYDAECRKILQGLTHVMRDKQREILIYLGPAQSLGQKVIRTTAETITRFRGMNIEIFSDEQKFIKRLEEVFIKYRLEQRQNA